MSSIEINVNVKGQKALIAKFNRFQGMLKAGMPDAWIKIGAALHSKIVPMTPKKSGTLVRSTEPKIGYMKVTSIASAINPKDGFQYARIQHDGGKPGGWNQYRGTIIGKKYMTIPLYATEPEAVRIIENEVDRIIALCGLG